MAIRLPAWLDDELHGRGAAVIGVTVLAALLVGWVVWANFSGPDETPPPPASAPRLAAAEPIPASAARPPVVAQAASDPVPLPICPHQTLDIETADGPQRGCVSATHTRQSGSVRSFSLDPEGVSVWHLAVDAIGPKVLSVRLRRASVGREPETLYVCDDSACNGASFGDPDAHGVRRLTLFATALQALPPGKQWKRPRPGRALRQKPADGASAVVGVPLARLRLTANLTVEADRIDPSLACHDGGLHVVESGGAVIEFCPLGGSGFDVAEDRQVRFTFRDLEGRQLVIALGADRTTIAYVTFGDLTCRSPMCGGASMRAEGDTADPLVARSFMFSGLTLLAAPSSKRSATLNGAVTLAAM